MQGRSIDGRGGGGTGEGDAPEARDREGGGKVLDFPGNWIGPLDELVPIGPAAEAPAAPTLSADAFWGEDAQSLHQAIEAPSLAPVETVATGPSETGAEPVQARSRSRPGRLLAPVALMLASIAALAIALHLAGVWGAAGGLARHRSRSTAQVHRPARVESAPIKPQWVRLKAPTARKPAARKPAARHRSAVRRETATRSTPVARTTTAVETVTVTPVAPTDSSGAAGTDAGSDSTPGAGASGGATGAGASGGATGATGTGGATGATGSGGATGATGSGGATGATGSGGATHGGGSGGAGSGATTGATHSGSAATGSGDVGAGNGLPGPGGPPAP